MCKVIAENETWKVERVHIGWNEKYYGITLRKEGLRIIINEEELDVLRATLNILLENDE